MSRVIEKRECKNRRQRVGKSGEDEACELLRLSGHRILERNFRLRFGELDIISRSGDGTLVFTEVKTDRTGRAGTPEAWITPRKQRQVAKMATLWLSRNPQSETQAMRFDAICVRIRPKATSVIHWPNAFLPQQRSGHW